MRAGRPVGVPAYGEAAPDRASSHQPNAPWGTSPRERQWSARDRHQAHRAYNRRDVWWCCPVLPRSATIRWFGVCASDPKSAFQCLGHDAGATPGRGRRCYHFIDPTPLSAAWPDQVSRAGMGRRRPAPAGHFGPAGAGGRGDWCRCKLTWPGPAIKKTMLEAVIVSAPPQLAGSSGQTDWPRHVA